MPESKSSTINEETPVKASIAVLVYIIGLSIAGTTGYMTLKAEAHDATQSASDAQARVDRLELRLIAINDNLQRDRESLARIEENVKFLKEKSQK